MGSTILVGLASVLDHTTYRPPSHVHPDTTALATLRLHALWAPTSLCMDKYCFQPALRHLLVTTTKLKLRLTFLTTHVQLACTVWQELNLILGTLSPRTKPTSQSCVPRAHSEAKKELKSLLIAVSVLLATCAQR